MRSPSYNCSFCAWQLSQRYRVHLSLCLIKHHTLHTFGSAVGTVTFTAHGLNLPLFNRRRLNRPRSSLGSAKNVLAISLSSNLYPSHYNDWAICILVTNDWGICILVTIMTELPHIPDSSDAVRKVVTSWSPHSQFCLAFYESIAAELHKTECCQLW